mgnify:CR=1 FL=1
MTNSCVNFRGVRKSHLHFATVIPKSNSCRLTTQPRPKSKSSSLSRLLLPSFSLLSVPMHVYINQALSLYCTFSSLLARAVPSILISRLLCCFWWQWPTAFYLCHFQRISWVMSNRTFWEDGCWVWLQELDYHKTPILFYFNHEIRLVSLEA